MAAASKTPTKYVPRLQSDYNAKFVAELQKELELKNVHEVPRLEKIVINVGLGRAERGQEDHRSSAKNGTLRRITGQAPGQGDSPRTPSPASNCAKRLYDRP